MLILASLQHSALCKETVASSLLAVSISASIGDSH